MQKKLNPVSLHVKKKRKQNKITQEELAQKAGVGLRFIRDLEQGKNALRTDKINDVLRLFGDCLGVIPIEKEVENE